MKRVGIRMAGRWVATAASGEERNLRPIIPHSKNGGCMNSECIGELGCAGQANV